GPPRSRGCGGQQADVPPGRGQKARGDGGLDAVGRQGLCGALRQLPWSRGTGEYGEGVGDRILKTGEHRGERTAARSVSPGTRTVVAGRSGEESSASGRKPAQAPGGGGEDHVRPLPPGTAPLRPLTGTPGPSSRSNDGQTIKSPVSLRGEPGSELENKWAYLDLNQGPHPYQGCALTD